MTNLFEIGIQWDDEQKEHVGILHSVTDKKIAVVRDAKLRKMLQKLSKMVRDKAYEIEHFPMPAPEPSRIIDPKSANGSRGLIVLPR